MHERYALNNDDKNKFDLQLVINSFVNYSQNKSMNTRCLLIVLMAITLVNCKKNVNPPPPSTPSKLTATAVSSSQINLSWEDKATNETGYKIERKTINGSFSLVATIGANASSYSDNGLTKNTIYTYRIFPYNLTGNGGYSNEATDTTFPDILSGLVAYYPFNGDLLDSNVTSMKRNGVAGGSINYAGDRFGNSAKAISFNSSVEGYVRTPSAINDLINTFTISCWVNALTNDRIVNEGITGSEGHGYQMILHPTHGGAWGVASENAGVGLCVGTNQVAVLEHTNGFIAAPLVYNKVLNGWHLITLVYENHIPKLYIDGILVKNGKATTILNVRPSNGNDINNGYGNYNTSGFGRGFSPTGTPPIPQFNGSIDEFRIYNRALDQDEITFLSKN